MLRVMPATALFPTLVYEARLPSAGWRTFNQRLLHECLQTREDDTAGRAWSATRYPGGYTSYGSLCRMHTMSPTFVALELDLEGRELAMTDCWINIMPRLVVHSLHLHPLSTISGTYYVRTPRGAPGIKFEDPRLDRFMAAPPRKPDCRPEHQPWVTVPASAGKLVLFESWLRHEVPPNPVADKRISISFNYSWF